MSAKQANAASFNPNAINLVQVASYERTIHAPLVRVWENVLDWEHLPHLHSSSFDYVELDAAGNWGWRTWSNAEHSGHVELSLANADSYVARTYQGNSQQSEIWTTLTANGEDTDIQVEFYFADVEESAVDGFGQVILALYTQLWDEDEQMMRERHIRLGEQRSDIEKLELGQRKELIQRLQLGEQITFQLRRREYQLRYHQGVLLAHPTICPHLLGPLTDSDLEAGQLTCPWHGYRFDLDSGACVAPESATCKLPSNAQLSAVGGVLVASA